MVWVCHLQSDGPKRIPRAAHLMRTLLVSNSEFADITPHSQINDEAHVGAYPRVSSSRTFFSISYSTCNLYPNPIAGFGLPATYCNEVDGRLP